MREPGTNYFTRYSLLSDTEGTWYPSAGVWLFRNKLRSFQLVVDVAYSDQDFTFGIGQEDHLGDFTLDRLSYRQRYLTVSVGLVVRFYPEDVE